LPVTCSAGYYQPNPLQASCYICPKGYFCPAQTGTAGTDYPTYDLTNFVCPKGYFCPEGSTGPTNNPCPKGTYNDHVGAWSNAECRPSPPGYYQDQTAAIAIDTTKICSAGYYCKIGSYCPNPSACTVPSGILYTDVGTLCTSGQYCPAGSAVPIPCTAGYYCATN
jgi:hypothetical protein